MAPADPDLLFQGGVLEINAGRSGLAYDSWRKSLALSSRYMNDIFRFVDQQRMSTSRQRRLERRELDG